MQNFLEGRIMSLRECERESLGGFGKGSNGTHTTGEGRVTRAQNNAQQHRYKANTQKGMSLSCLPLILVPKKCVQRCPNHD